MVGSAEAALSATAFATVALFGVPRCLPPRRSPGLDPRGIAVFATFAISQSLGRQVAVMSRCL